jgi:hypothetical protein
VKIRFGFWLAAAVFFTACNNGINNTIPDGVLTPEQMKPVLTDIHLADAIADNAGEKGKDASSTAIQYNNAVFAKHKIKAAQFYESMHFYENHPQLMNKMYEELIVEMSKTEAKVKSSK